MSTLSLRLPESLHRSVGELAREEGISVNQLISTAVAEKLSALRTAEILGERAVRGSRKAFDRALARVPSGTPMPGDELPPPRRAARPRPKAARSPASARRRP
ncbi:MAG: toxin-antitoxin system HicB family antitoxin [Acidobacteria bacterium]|nr:MAG: toxin-antitoxin system HicB family antitoxin [Acidobacteriota bacterium]